MTVRYSTAKQRSPFPFLRLPAEIRNKVYELVSQEEHEDHLAGQAARDDTPWRRFERQRDEHWFGGLLDGPPPPESSILRTCKQIRAEAKANFAPRNDG